MLVLATLGAPERRRRRDRHGRAAAPEPPPAPVTTARATVADAVPVSLAEAERWLAAAGREDAEAALVHVARAVRAHRLASADPAVHEPALGQALVVRAGHGAGEQVAEGRWSAARELPPPPAERRRRVAGLRPQERLAALLSGRSQPLACEELALRARHDLDAGHLCQAALQLRAALDAAVVELGGAATTSAELRRRMAELSELRPDAVTLADAALSGGSSSEAAETLAAMLQRLEAALRSRLANDI